MRDACSGPDPRTRAMRILELVRLSGRSDEESQRHARKLFRGRLLSSFPRDFAATLPMHAQHAVAGGAFLRAWTAVTVTGLYGDLLAEAVAEFERAGGSERPPDWEQVLDTSGTLAGGPEPRGVARFRPWSAALTSIFATAVMSEANGQGDVTVLLRRAAGVAASAAHALGTWEEVVRARRIRTADAREERMGVVEYCLLRCELAFALDGRDALASALPPRDVEALGAPETRAALRALRAFAARRNDASRRAVRETLCDRVDESRSKLARLPVTVSGALLCCTHEWTERAVAAALCHQATSTGWTDLRSAFLTFLREAFPDAASPGATPSGTP